MAALEVQFYTCYAEVSNPQLCQLQWVIQQAPFLHSCVQYLFMTLSRHQFILLPLLSSLLLELPSIQKADSNAKAAMYLRKQDKLKRNEVKIYQLKQEFKVALETKL